MRSSRRRTCRTSGGGRGISSAPPAWAFPWSSSLVSFFVADVAEPFAALIHHGDLRGSRAPRGFLRGRPRDLLLPVDLDRQELDQALVHADPALDFVNDRRIG